MRGIFPIVHEAVARIVKPKDIRWIGFSHFEVDECGALNEWLKVAPAAQTVCSQVGAVVNLNDFANRPPRGLAADEVFSTGMHGSTFVGNGAQALHDLGCVMREVYGEGSEDTRQA